MNCGTTAFITEQYYKHGRSIVAVQRSFEKNYGKPKAATKTVIRRCVRNFP